MSLSKSLFFFLCDSRQFTFWINNLRFISRNRGVKPQKIDQNVRFLNFFFARPKRDSIAAAWQTVRKSFEHITVAARGQEVYNQSKVVVCMTSDSEWLPFHDIRVPSAKFELCEANASHSYMCSAWRVHGEYCAHKSLIEIVYFSSDGCL